MKTMHRLVLAWLLCCAAAPADSAGDWLALREASRPLGLADDRVERTLEQCRATRRSAQEAEVLFRPVFAAHAEGLPPECVFIKIEEGLAKQVEPARIAAAATERLGCLRRAGQLVAAGGAHAGGDQRRLVQQTCVALESGLPDAVLAAVFNRPGGYRYGRMIHVVEAAETLHLAGLEPEHTQHLMNDFLDRDLNRAEIARAVEIVVSEKAKGRDFAAIHAELWVSAGN